MYTESKEISSYIGTTQRIKVITINGRTFIGVIISNGGCSSPSFMGGICYWFRVTSIRNVESIWISSLCVKEIIEL